MAVAIREGQYFVLSIRVGAINWEKQWLVAAMVWVLHLSKEEEGSMRRQVGDRAGLKYVTWAGLHRGLEHVQLDDTMIGVTSLLNAFISRRE